MPRGDRTGPEGLGAMTGRGAGFCTGNAVPGFMNPGAGRGMAMGRGNRCGGGRRFRQFAPVSYVSTHQNQDVLASPFYSQPQAGSADSELDYLKQQAQAVSQSLESITKRIEALEKTDKAGE